MRIEITDLTADRAEEMMDTMDAVGLRYDEDYEALYGGKWEIVGVAITASDPYRRRDALEIVRNTIAIHEAAELANPDLSPPNSYTEVKVSPTDGRVFLAIERDRGPSKEG